MIINILTIFPDFFKQPFSTSIFRRAEEQGAVEYRIIDIREFAQDKHALTDDRPYGGGPGMVMMIEPIDKALAHIDESKKENAQALRTLRVLTSAKGRRFSQQMAESWSKLDQLSIICGHYEGVDERVAEHLVDQEVRIGDYVLTGGESAAIVMVDAVIRLLPRVLGNQASTQNESHTQVGVLGHPQYTQPRRYQGWEVPEVLLSGDHERIAQWRQANKKVALD